MAGASGEKNEIKVALIIAPREIDYIMQGEGGGGEEGEVRGKEKGSWGKFHLVLLFHSKFTLSPKGRPEKGAYPRAPRYKSAGWGGEFKISYKQKKKSTSGNGTQTDRESSGSDLERLQEGKGRKEKTGRQKRVDEKRV